MENGLSQKGSVERVIRNVCPLCPSHDGVLIRVKDGKIVSIRGDGNHPHTRGNICKKGIHEHEMLSNSKRITYPLLKENRGWSRISWNNAMDIIADRLQKIRERYGLTAVCGIGPEKGFLEFFLSSLGSPNINNLLDLCALPGQLADFVTVGDGITTYLDDTADFRNSKCILLAGTNLVASNPLQWRNVTMAMAEGAKLIVIDPRRSECAEKADIWLRVRPGSDGALILGMLNIIVNEKLYDEQFVSEWCAGFEELKQRVQDIRRGHQENSPTVCTNQTRIPPKQSRGTAVQQFNANRSSPYHSAFYHRQHRCTRWKPAAKKARRLQEGQGYSGGMPVAPRNRREATGRTAVSSLCRT